MAAVIKLDTSLTLDPVRKARAHLEDLAHVKIAAAEAYTEAVKQVAEGARMDPAAIKAYINAIVRDKVAEHRRKVDQLSLMFEELE